MTHSITNAFHLYRNKEQLT